jgi:hypothetical protein
MKYETHDLDLALVAYMDAMRKDYGNDWSTPWNNGSANSTPRYDLATDKIKKGQKFLRIWHMSGSSRSSHCFIVMQDCIVNVPTKKGVKLSLKVGDILKCASWKAPALNFVRGNILEPNYGNCKWTGAA